MINTIYVELLKLRRSKIMLIWFSAPILTGLLFFLLQISGNSLKLWPLHFGVGFTAWAFFMLPMTATVITTMLAQLEHGPKTWGHLFSLPVPKWQTFAAKAFISLFLIATMTAFMAFLMWFGGWLGGEINPEAKLLDPRPLLALADAYSGEEFNLDDMEGFFGSGEEMKAMIMNWKMVLAERLSLVFLSSFLLVAIQLWAALFFRNFLIPLALGVGGGFVAVVAQASEYGIYFPWLLPVNMLGFFPERLEFAFNLGFYGGLVAFILMILHMSRMEIK